MKLLVLSIVHYSGIFLETIERRASTSTRYKLEHSELHQAISLQNLQLIEEFLDRNPSYFNGPLESVILCLNTDLYIKQIILDMYNEAKYVKI